MMIFNIECICYSYCNEYEDYNQFYSETFKLLSYEQKIAVFDKIFMLCPKLACDFMIFISNELDETFVEIANKYKRLCIIEYKKNELL